MYEARGDKQRALEYYGRFAALWKDADPVLQPAVREVAPGWRRSPGKGSARRHFRHARRVVT